jgi:hypothetical protein
MPAGSNNGPNDVPWAPLGKIRKKGKAGTIMIPPPRQPNRSGLRC